MHVIFGIFCGIRDRNLDVYQRVILARQPLENPPEFLLVAQHSPLLHLVASAHKVAENRDFVLLRRDGPRWGSGDSGSSGGAGVAVLATSPDAQTDPKGRPGYRLGRQPLRITLVNLGTEPISLGLQGNVEPVNPEGGASPAEIAIEFGSAAGDCDGGPGDAGETMGSAANRAGGADDLGAGAGGTGQEGVLVERYRVGSGWRWVRIKVRRRPDKGSVTHLLPR